ncbi:hypothetical protein XthCFBP4691_03050 [Xanthomonas theicola]|uniref:N-acetyltransferase domain-containing protein n=1 Tax=Xanthomonas theicola TaxID=56464 RepID=A0A2S6ZK82_9XANT|nr:hypothetical protein XthCFBP4691_03050 [Xanthomonas theicola]QNH27137.1 GNAT family N-acetyltransferase [Xanthomonas theicola]
MALRHEDAQDLPALRDMFRQQRWGEFAAMPWDDAAKAALLDQQFDAQRRDYTRRHPDARLLVLTEYAQVVGRLYLAPDTDGTVRILDIALRAACRGQGIGRALIGAVQVQARRVRLQVYKDNPAAALYRQLGFRAVADTGVAWQMQWDQPDAVPVS